MLCKAGCAGGDEADQEEHQKIHPLAQIEDGRQFNQRSNRAGAQGTIMLTAHVLILLRIRKFEILVKHKFQVIHDLVGISLEIDDLLRQRNGRCRTSTEACRGAQDSNSNQVIHIHFVFLLFLLEVSLKEKEVEINQSDKIITDQKRIIADQYAQIQILNNDHK